MNQNKSYIPNGLSAVTPYLTVDNAAALLDFLVEAFGAEVLERHEDGERIAHAKVRLYDTILEASDASEEWPALNAALHIYVPDVDATHARALASGATELHAPTDHDYGERGSGIRSPGNINLFLATAK